jgi:hypothetical protein
MGCSPSSPAAGSRCAARQYVPENARSSSSSRCSGSGCEQRTSGSAGAAEEASVEYRAQRLDSEVVLLVGHEQSAAAWRDAEPGIATPPSSPSVVARGSQQRVLSQQAVASDDDGESVAAWLKSTDLQLQPEPETGSPLEPPLDWQPEPEPEQQPKSEPEPEPEPAPEPEVEPEPEPEPEPAVTEASAVRSIAGFGKQAHTLQSRHTELQSELDTLLASSDEEEQQPEPEAPAPEPSPVLPRPSTVPVLNLSLIQPDMRHHDARTRAEESGASRKRSDRPRSRAEWHRAKIRGGRSYTGSRGSGSADGDQAQQQGSRLKRIESFDGGTFDPE